MLRRLFRPSSPAAVLPSTPAPSAANLSRLNLSRLPLLDAGELVQLLDATNLVRSIRRLVAVQDSHWNALYQPALDRFLLACQLAPASMAHHHAGPGGLATHTLESLEIALRNRKPLVLPRNADPDTTARQEHIWTYALFVAVIFHDIGKLHTTTRLRLSSNQYWNPYLNLSQLRHETYCIEFVTAPYKLHQHIANAGLHLLPKSGMSWLQQYPQILSHVCAYLYGDIFEAGIIGELAQKADGESVARNLKNHGDRVRFPGATAIPLIDRIMIGLRQMLDAKELKLNGHGADGWSDGQHLWLVCGTVAKKLIDYLRQEGSPVPADNTRIFDTLQEHGYILPTEAGKAIWHTVITGPGNAFRFELTMLKFEVARLLPPTRRPSPFEGTITVVATPATNTPDSVPAPTPQVTSPRPPAPTAVAARTITQPPPDTAPDPVSTSAGTAATGNQINAHGNLPDWMQDEATDTAPDCIELTVAAPESSNNPAEPAPTASANPSPHAGETSFDDIRPQHLDDNTGQYFMDWLARMLRQGKLPVNRQDAVVHVVPEGALVVSPRAFKEFVVFFDLYCRENNSARMTVDAAAKHVQKKVEKLRQNIKNASGMSVHAYLINGPNRVSRVSGFLFDPVRLFGHVGPPAINPLLVSAATMANAKLTAESG